MSKFLITFNVEEEHRASLEKKIKDLGAWARIMPNAWCVLSDDKNTVIIRDTLKKEVGDSGRLFVINITDSPWASFCVPKEVTNWLKEN